MRAPFVRETVSGDFGTPVGLTFDALGRLYLWNKGGQVFLIENEEISLLLDISEEVANTGDNGCLGFALHPDFIENGHFYLFYTVDRHHLDHFGRASYDPNKSTTWAATIARLTRYTADPATDRRTVLPGSRQVLMGTTRADGPPVMFVSHGAADLAFGADGSLLVAMGDGAPWTHPSAGGPPYYGFEAQGVVGGFYPASHDVGSFRAQLPDSKAGKILRIDPETGLGMPGNPFYDPAQPEATRSMVWALGLRNPFRISVRPGTGLSDPAAGQPGTLYIGDVAGGLWEELNVQRLGGQNFGWPLYDGYYLNEVFNELSPANQLAPNPAYGTGDCDQPFFNFRQLLRPDIRGVDTVANPCDPSQPVPASIPSFRHERAAVIWPHPDTIVNPRRGHVRTPSYDSLGQPYGALLGYPESSASGDNFVGYSIVGGDFYTGSTFPPEFHGAYFVADHSGWIRALHFDLNDTLTAVTEILRDTTKITDLAVNPLDGSISYVTFPTGLHKLSFGVNVPPVPVLAAEPLYGPGPLTVAFNAAASYDPQGEAFGLAWDFGDGNSSTELAPVHTFVPRGHGPETFTVRLTATDSVGQVSVVTQEIWVNNTPPSVQITSFPDGMTYPMGGPTWVPLAGTATDAEHPTSELVYVWQTYLHHNTHFHPEPPDTARETGTLLPPAGCEDEIYYYRVRLEVTDPEGLANHQDYYLYPECVEPFVDLVSLDVTIDDGLPHLRWQAVEGDSTAGYEVQWASVNQQFIPIGYLPATGSGAYQLVHETPVYATNSYRLRLLHTNGRSRYSDEVEVIMLENWMRVYPNPVRDILTLEYDHTTTGQVSWQLFDLHGRLVKQRTWDDLLQGGRREVDLRDLPRGTYLYRSADQLHQRSGKVLKWE